MSDSQVQKLSKLQSALTLKQFLVMLGTTVAGLAAAHQFIGIPILRNELRPLIKEMIEEHEKTGHISAEFGFEMRNWMRRLDESIKAQKTGAR